MYFLPLSVCNISLCTQPTKKNMHTLHKNQKNPYKNFLGSTVLKKIQYKGC